MVKDWRRLLDEAIDTSGDDRTAAFLSLATVNLDGGPANRTVAFRGFYKDSLVVVTDRRTDKVPQLESRAEAEACWYFRGSREQFRLLGPVQVVGPDQSGNPSMESVREGLWRGLSDATRARFFGPPPGELIGDAHRDDPPLFSGDSTAPDTFCVLILEPRSVDYLDLRPFPNQRLRWKLKNGHWVQARIHP